MLAEQLRACSGLRALWEAGELCDCTLCPAGVSVESGLRAHRVVLAAASPYCRALLSGPWGAQRGDACAIDLPTLSAGAVQSVLSAIYSGELQARPPALLYKQGCFPLAGLGGLPPICGSAAPPGWRGGKQRYAYHIKEERSVAAKRF